MVDCRDDRVANGTLWMKPKIPEFDVLEDHDKQVPQDRLDDEDEFQIPKNNDDDNRRRICHVCNKGFSSGKALGGHMRIHVQASKKQLHLSGKKGKKLKPLVSRYYKKRILQQDDDDEENYNNQLQPTCSICGKNFPSLKSLFGHMRCHPERAWRGIQPPNLNTSDKNTASAATATVVPVWSVTAKRGRKPIADEEDTNSGPNKKDEEQLHDAVHHLMLLANGDSSYDNNMHGIREESETSNSNSLTSKAENDELDYHICELSMINEKKKRRKKKLKFLDSVQDVASEVPKYKCNTCGRRFATHQALGGHKASHNKCRMVTKNSDVTTNVEEAAASNSKLLADSNKNFTRNPCQWGSPINDEAAGASSSQLTSPGEVSHTTRVLDFDLNELPPPNHEDELAANHDYFSFLPV